ncbi:lipopolysaccharide biosynthesis protein [Thalassolituus marinus]|uniref:Oligosaccharide flippase family protein n=1 Tax=Thalassolituus marinus TaxID=671053 RepID=A0ABS7ZV08_9GAMM|nr:oligosaccharide flippase family protein [Thalassolituus marinus]MCA6065043.1 oligosaccharide flippase family protein [Thalassolituus marinus]
MKVSIFHKSIAMLLSGTAMSQLIGIATLPLLTRLYSADEMGVLAIYTSVVTTLLTVVCLRLESAIPVQKSEEDAKEVLFLCIQLAAIVSMVVFLLTICAFSFDVLPENMLEYIYFIPVGVFFGGVYVALNAFALFKGGFQYIAKSRIIQAVSCAAVQVSGAFLYQSSVWLIVGFILNLSAGINYLKKRLNLKSVFFFLDVRKSKQLIQRNSSFPRYSIIESLFNTAGVQFPILVIAYGMSVSEAGLIFLAMKLIQAPMAMLGTSIAQVYYSQASKKFADGEISQFTADVLKIALRLGVGPIIGLSILAPLIIKYFLGYEWEQVGHYMLIMMPWYVMQFISSPMSPIMYIMEKQKLFMYITIFGLFWKLSLAFIGVFVMHDAVQMLVIGNVIFYFLCFYTFLKISGLSFFAVADVIANSFFIISIWVVVALLLNFFLEEVVRNV